MYGGENKNKNKNTNYGLILTLQQLTTGKGRNNFS
jgi:hypothetical protein